MEQGVAAEPPCPVVFDQRWVYPAMGFERYKHEVRAWSKTACPHPGFALADEPLRRVSLLEAIDSHGGADAFPVLTSSLPAPDEGAFTSETSALCLRELDRLAGMMRAESTMAVLIDVDSGDALRVNESADTLISLPRFPPGNPRVITFDERHRMSSTEGLNPRATTTWMTADAVVHVRSAATGEVCFSSQEFTQAPAGDEWIFRAGPDRSVRHSSPITFWAMGVERWPVHMRAEIRPLDIDVFLPGVAELRALFAASVLTGNSVIWY
ncbi:MAG TPA: hypothetical protein DGG94_00510 [Micromonosporaceae bacterium]|nr:hypothetical protein [Micromonosporaceae bacterium]